MDMNEQCDALAAQRMEEFAYICGVLYKLMVTQGQRLSIDSNEIKVIPGIEKDTEAYF